MMQTNDEFRQDTENNRLFLQEELILEIGQSVAALLAKHGVSRAELATRIGVSKAAVTQWLGGTENPGVRRVADMFWALGYKANVTPTPVEVGACPKGSTNTYIVRGVDRLVAPKAAKAKPPGLAA